PDKGRARARSRGERTRYHGPRVENAVAQGRSVPDKRARWPEAVGDRGRERTRRTGSPAADTQVSIDPSALEMRRLTGVARRELADAAIGGLSARRELRACVCGGSHVGDYPHPRSRGTDPRYRASPLDLRSSK